MSMHDQHMKKLHKGDPPTFPTNELLGHEKMHEKHMKNQGMLFA